MKFTKENLRERIATDLGDSRKLSDRSINEMIDTMMQFAGEETELEAFFAQVKPAFVTANEHPGQTPPATPPATPPGDQFTKQGLTAEDVAKIVAESMKPFAENFGKFQAEKTTEQLFEDAKKKFMEEHKPDESNERIKAILDRTYRTIKPTVKADSDLTLLIASMKNEFEDLTQIAGISTPYIPVEAGGGGAGAGTAEQYRLQRDALIKEGFIKATPGA